MAHHQRIPRQGLQSRTVTDVVFVRPCVAEAGHADGNNVRFNLFEAFVIHAPVAHDARTKIVDHHVRNFDKLLSNLASARVRHVNDRALLATEKVPSKSAATRTKVERIPPLNLNDLSTLVGQDARRYWPGHDPGKIKNADAVQGAAALFFHVCRPAFTIFPSNAPQSPDSVRQPAQ